MKACANPRCVAAARLGRNVCGSCEAKRDAIIVFGILFGGVAIVLAFMRFA